METMEIINTVLTGVQICISAAVLIYLAAHARRMKNHMDREREMYGKTPSLAVESSNASDEQNKRVTSFLDVVRNTDRVPEALMIERPVEPVIERWELVPGSVRMRSQPYPTNP
jgi:hypothetical protein